MGRYGVLLSRLLPEIPFESEFSLREHTTIGVGGSADAFSPRNVTELTALHRILLRCRIPYFVLGGGSNLLPCDEDYGGVVLRMTAFDRIFSDGEYLYAESGVSVGKLLSYCLKNGLSGLEFLVGIPAKIGGLICMNAGVREGHVCDVVESVTVSRHGRILPLSGDECAFGRKESVFQRNGDLILSAKFKVERGEKASIAERIRRAYAARAHLPHGRSMGCVFKNPYPSLSAGQLIEACGCKGWRQGGATVSEEHANFILNEGGATAQDIKILIGWVKNAVYAQTGLILQEEIRLIE